MKNFKTYVTKANELISKRGLDYSPELFTKTLAEIMACPANQKAEKLRQKNMFINTEVNEKLSFMNNHLTTDKRIK